AGPLGADPTPPFARAPGERELRPLRAATHPNQAEIAHRRAARGRFPFEVYDIDAVPPGQQCVHGAEHATTDDDDRSVHLVPSASTRPTDPVGRAQLTRR